MLCNFLKGLYAYEKNTFDSCGLKLYFLIWTGDMEWLSKWYYHGLNLLALVLMWLYLYHLTFFALLIDSFWMFCKHTKKPYAIAIFQVGFIKERYLWSFVTMGSVNSLGVTLTNSNCLGDCNKNKLWKEISQQTDRKGGKRGNIQ